MNSYSVISNNKTKNIWTQFAHSKIMDGFCLFLLGQSDGPMMDGCSNLSILFMHIDSPGGCCLIYPINMMHFCCTAAFE